MKLEIRRLTDRLNVMVLAEVGGELIPGQKKLTHYTEAGNLPYIVVEFEAYDLTIRDEVVDTSDDRPETSIPEVSALFARLSPENQARFIRMYEGLQ